MPLTTLQMAPQIARPHLRVIVSQDSSQPLDYSHTSLTGGDYLVTLSENDTP